MESATGNPDSKRFDEEEMLDAAFDDEDQLNTWRVRKLVDYEDIETGIKKIKR